MPLSINLFSGSRDHPNKLVLLSLNWAIKFFAPSQKIILEGWGTFVIIYSYSYVDKFNILILYSLSNSLVPKAKNIPLSSKTQLRQYIAILNTSLISRSNIIYIYPQSL